MLANSYLPKPRQELAPEKPTTCASTFVHVTTFLGRLSLEAIHFIFPG